MLTNTALQLSQLMKKFVTLDEKEKLSLPGTVRIKLSRLVRQLEGVEADFNKAREGLIRELGTEDKDKNVTVDQTGENWPKFLAEIEKLLATEAADVAVPSFEEADLRLDKNDIPIAILNEFFRHGLLIDKEAVAAAKAKAAAEAASQKTEATPVESKA